MGTRAPNQRHRHDPNRSRALPQRPARRALNPSRIPHLAAPHEHHHPARLPHRPTPRSHLSDTHRWAQIHALLHEDTISPHARLAGLFMLLFAQPISNICRMRLDQVTLHDDNTVTVRFADTPIQMPALLDELLRTHLRHPGTPAITIQRHGWLFPGRNPGTHRVTESNRRELVRHNIHPSNSRQAALFSLAAEIPAPVLADLTGITDKTATRWATLAARTWNTYIHTRTTNTPHQTENDPDETPA